MTAIDCGPNLTATCATAYSTSDQTLVAGTASNIQHDTVPFSYGITTTGGVNGGFRVGQAGIYKLIPSVQYLASGNGNITIWIKINGVNLQDSATLTLFKNGEEGVITCEYLLPLNADDLVQIWGIAQSANCLVNYISSGGSGANAYPAAPGVITNMYRIR